MSEKQPNILWICTDQQRWDTLGCYGNPFVHTPNIDALAAGGVLFERCFSQSPVCTPSRASFLTGRYPRTTRCRQNGQEIPEDEVSGHQALCRRRLPLRPIRQAPSLPLQPDPLQDDRTPHRRRLHRR